MSETVILDRSGRTVLASGPTGPIGPRSLQVLKQTLSYSERRFVQDTSSERGGGYEFIPRELFAVEPRSGRLAFLLGMRPRVTVALAEAGVAVQYRGTPVRTDLPAQHELDWAGLFADFQIYPGQDDALCKILASDGGTIGATTGAGKSVIIRMLARLCGKATVHVVTKGSELAREIEADLRSVIPGVGFVGAGRRRWGRVTVVLADSLHLAETDKVGLVLADEVHELGAPKYSALLGRYRHAAMYGFSATLGVRSDRRDAEVEAIFGPTLYELPYHEAQAMGRVVPITVEWIRVDTGADPTDGLRLQAAKERAGVWRHDARNRAIADRCRLFAADEQVLVMVKTIEHAAYLKQLLPDYELCYASGSMDEDRLNRLKREGVLPDSETPLNRARLGRMREDFSAGRLKKVISNYVWSRGVNFRALSVLVRADAASSEILAGQIPGRICRRIPGVKESALLVDVWDDWNRGYLNRTFERRRSYAKRQWTQVDRYRNPTEARADG